MNGKRLPASLQPGSGSTDFFVAAIGLTPGSSISGGCGRRGFTFSVRAQGTQKRRLGSGRRIALLAIRTGPMNRRTGPRMVHRACRELAALSR